MMMMMMMTMIAYIMTVNGNLEVNSYLGKI